MNIWVRVIDGPVEDVDQFAYTSRYVGEDCAVLNVTGVVVAGPITYVICGAATVVVSVGTIPQFSHPHAWSVPDGPTAVQVTRTLKLKPIAARDVVSAVNAPVAHSSVPIVPGVLS